MKARSRMGVGTVVGATLFIMVGLVVMSTLSYVSQTQFAYIRQATNAQRLVADRAGEFLTLKHEGGLVTIYNNETKTAMITYIVTRDGSTTSSNLILRPYPYPPQTIVGDINTGVVTKSGNVFWVTRG